MLILLYQTVLANSSNKTKFSYYSIPQWKIPEHHTDYTKNSEQSLQIVETRWNCPTTQFFNEKFQNTTQIMLRLSNIAY